ncbi:MAG: hypothetical protein AAF402_04690 [Pseudomonadota bacterium]
MTFNIICADWSGKPEKRSAWNLLAGSNCVSPLAADGSLSYLSLIDYATNLDSPTLIGIDAALGVPAHVVERYQPKSGHPDAGFFRWVDWLFQYGEPFNPVSDPASWSTARPFIAVPKGKGSKSCFPNAGIHLHRSCERGLNSNSALIVSGIPGTVGSGSRALWQEISTLAEMRKSRRVRYWPYHGAMQSLLTGDQIVVAEIYPKICYGLALSERLPAPLISIAKTRPEARERAIEQLLKRCRGGLGFADLDRCYENEDEFDAMISCVGIHRLLGECGSSWTAIKHSASEGGILGKVAIEIARSSA